jgi:hypothetical protein
MSAPIVQQKKMDSCLVRLSLAPQDIYAKTGPLAVYLLSSLFEITI